MTERRREREQEKLRKTEKERVRERRREKERRTGRKIESFNCEPFQFRLLKFV